MSEKPSKFPRANSVTRSPAVTPQPRGDESGRHGGPGVGTLGKSGTETRGPREPGEVPHGLWPPGRPRPHVLVSNATRRPGEGSRPEFVLSAEWPSLDYPTFPSPVRWKLLFIPTMDFFLVQNCLIIE